MMNTAERQNFMKMKYECGVWKHKCSELEKQLEEMRNAPVVHVENVSQTVPAHQKYVLPVLCYSAEGLRHTAKKYGIDPSLPRPKLIKALREYEKANGLIVEKVAKE